MVDRTQTWLTVACMHAMRCSRSAVRGAGGIRAASQRTTADSDSANRTAQDTQDARANRASVQASDEWFRVSAPCMLNRGQGQVMQRDRLTFGLVLVCSVGLGCPTRGRAVRALARPPRGPFRRDSLCTCSEALLCQRGVGGARGRETDGRHDSVREGGCRWRRGGHR